MSNYFIEEPETLIEKWDRCIYCKTLPDELGYRQLTSPLLCGDSYIPEGFVWNGAGAFVEENTFFDKIKNFWAGIVRKVFPRWKHPIASCRHDWRCSLAKTPEERKIADKLFYKDIGVGGTKSEQVVGYIGVRVGAYLGIGVDHKIG